MIMEKITGNYLTQANKDFPLDCETLDYLQRLAALAALAGNIGGDKVVLYGCEANAEGTRRGAGYVFVKTREHPAGEVLPWEGGPTAGGMYVKQEDVAVSANNTDYPKAYTRRSMAPGIGAENYRWEDFTDIKTIKELMKENRELREELAAKDAPPLGIVEMWAGQSVPEGYVMCDGRALRMEDYRELYGVLGTTFNTAFSAGGTRYTTEPGYFRVPDLRGRFVVGQHDSDNDYREKGSGGGKKTVILTEEELPAHRHSMTDYYYPENRKTIAGNVANNPSAQKYGSNKTDTDNDGMLYFNHDTGTTGGSAGHENRPPYYVLAYIMRVK